LIGPSKGQRRVGARRLSLTTTSIALVILTGGLATNSAAKPNSLAKASHPALAATPPLATEPLCSGPKLGPNLPSTVYGVCATSVGPAQIAPAMSAPKSRLLIHLDIDLSAAYLDPFSDPLIRKYSQGANGIPVPIPHGFKPTNPVRGCDYFAGYLSAYLYALTKGGVKSKPYGVFAPTEISTLAFGLIPMTATVTLKQPIVHGAIQPLLAQLYELQVSSCDPAWLATVPSFYSRVTGQAELSISNVKVDGQPVDVGATCRTEKPLELNLQGSQDLTSLYVPQFGGPLRQEHDTEPATQDPNSYPMYPDSSDLTIPAFTGCRSATGDDISRAVSALVSSSDNRIVANQGGVAVTGQPGTQHLDLNNPTKCPPDVPASYCVAPPYLPIELPKK
jgi:hypothetical protein